MAQVPNVEVMRPGTHSLSLGGGGGAVHHGANQRQQQQYGKAAATYRSPLATSGTRSRSPSDDYVDGNDGGSSWREGSGGGGRGRASSGGRSWAGGEMEDSAGLGGVEKRGRMSSNLSLSDFPQLAFLAQGAMCKCFVARETSLSREPVVLKMAIENGPTEAERDLNKELSLLHGLAHPNLIAMYGCGQTPKGKTFIVIEFLDGGTMRARLDAARGGLGFWPALRHAMELASVMSYLHEEAIPGMCVMHRDLKPDNLGLKGNVIKLFDLGLAKVIKRSETEVNDFFQMSGEVGSLRYMSPEVASQRPYNEKADVHSFAVVMWELVTGWLPYAGHSPEMFMLQAVEHGQRPLMQFKWDPSFKSLLSSCWAEDPNERPSFSYIHEALLGLMAEKGIPTSGNKAPSSASSSSSSRSKGILSRLLPGRKNRSDR